MMRGLFLGREEAGSSRTALLSLLLLSGLATRTFSELTAQEGTALEAVSIEHQSEGPGGQGVASQPSNLLPEGPVHKLAEVLVPGCTKLGGSVSVQRHKDLHRTHGHRHDPYFDDLLSNNTSLVVQAGGCTHLDCRVSLLRDKTVSWIRRRAGQPPMLLTVGGQTHTRDERFSVSFRYPGNWRLRINRVSKVDEGVYECQLSTHPPSLFRVHLLVEAPEVAIVDELGLPLSEQYYEAGSTLQLRCMLQGSSRLEGGLQWLHGNESLQRETLRGGVAIWTQTFKNRGRVESTLRVGRLGPGDAGTYSCGAPPWGAHTVLVHVLTEESLGELQEHSGLHVWPLVYILTTAGVALMLLGFT